MAGHYRDQCGPDDFPFEEIKRNPSTFYDVDRYPFMNFDQDSYVNVGILFGFIDDLQQHCSLESKDPFVFLASTPLTVNLTITLRVGDTLDIDVRNSMQSRTRTRA